MYQAPERRGVPFVGRVGAFILPAALSPAVLVAAYLILSPSAADAQLRVGGHLVKAADTFDGSYGLGLRAGIDFPLLPFDLMASGEYFFPNCPPEDSDCGLYELTLDANFRLLFPLVRPYISAGLAYRNISPMQIGADETVAGLGLGLGVDVELAGVRLFGESRYEFLNAPEKQFLWRLGALFEVF